MGTGGEKCRGGGVNTENFALNCGMGWHPIKHDRKMEEAENQRARSLTLEQFCSQIRYVVEQGRLEAWVTAEIAQVSVSRGHYYIELVQKGETTDSPVAKLRCMIWSSMAEGVLSGFWQATGGDIAAGMKVMAYIRTSFHAVFGLSGQIMAIDPNYTLGDLEARRRAIWEKLQAEGVADMNKSLDMPTVVQRIAIISAKTAAGYGDFMNQLRGNGYGISFRTELFEATVQGAEAEASIVRALEMVAERADDFDVAVVIRGGGSKMDLACFDSYEVASNIAQFPLPVITGIGHERDRSIADMVAHTAVKTPTAVAEFIIGVDSDFMAMLDELGRRLVAASDNEIADNKSLLDTLTLRLISAAKGMVGEKRNDVEQLRTRACLAASQCLAHARQGLAAEETRMAMAAGREVERNAASLAHMEDRVAGAARRIIETKRGELDSYGQRLRTSDPRAVLARGFSMTTNAEGRMIKSAKDAAAGDTIVTHMADGEIRSVVRE